MVVQTVPLSALVARVDLGLTVLCGSSALDRPVRWAHVSELEDPTPYLVGEELLLTAGVRFPSDVPSYVAGLVSSGVSAIGFGVEPEFSDVPSSLVEACLAAGMPLLAVPPSTPFLAVSQALGALLAEIAVREQRMLADSQRALTRAAVRPRPVESVLTTLAVVLGCRADLVDVASAPADVASLVSRVASGTGPRSASAQVGDEFVTLDPVESAVLVVRRAVVLSAAERAVVTVALALLGLLRRDVASERGQVARVAAAAVLGSVVDLSGVLGAGPYRVVAGDGPLDYEVLALRYGPLVDVSPDGFAALVPASFVADGPVGVSGPVSEADVAAGRAEAVSLLARARATGSPALPGAGLAELVDPEVGLAFARRELSALLGRPELVETLRVWLAQHGSWDRAAGVLGVHRNSVRHRIAHAARLLGVDLASADVRASLWLALTWLR